VTKRPNASLLGQIEGDVLSNRPLADALRKCVILGGQAGSTDLREWALRELKGYFGEDEVPAYRTVAAPILADATTGNAIVRDQRLSTSQLPDVARDVLHETFTFREGIGEIEAMISQAGENGEGVKLSLPEQRNWGG
jgi:hypothetical protein